MSTLATDHLRRLEQLLATARAEYDSLAYIILEGATQLTFHSNKRSVTVPVVGDDVGHFNGMLAEAALARIAALEKEVVEAHHQVVVEADEQQVEDQALDTYRQQERAGKARKPAGAILEAHATTSPLPDADST
jgi:hypothetical protein